METISNGEFRDPVIDTAIDLGEVALDELLESFQNETLSQIPIVKTLYSITKAGFAIRDYLFLKKLLLFISGFKTPDEIFKGKLEEKYKDPEYRKNVGKDLINALSLFDQVSKSEYLFKIFHSYISDLINYDEFKQFIYALQRIDTAKLKILKYFYEASKPSNQYRQGEEYILMIKQEIQKNAHFLQEFIFAGLISIDMGQSTKIGDFPVPFGLPGKMLPNEFGAKFLAVTELLSAEGSKGYGQFLLRDKAMNSALGTQYKRQLKSFFKDEFETHQKVELVRFKSYEAHSRRCKVESIGGNIFYVRIDTNLEGLIKDQLLLIFHSGNYCRLFKPI
ncbi:MAG: hypothetical protein EA368_10785 [Leptolyngbya sp. DLM2.Bin27]|nr:MAG: hypothetical protein EA368_10785 [Leptolyngbya sp. DLM2.Bin27]